MTPDIELAAAEIYEERAAIAEHDGLLTREDAERIGMLESERYRESCEVRELLRMPLDERRAMLERIGKARGADALDRLKQALQREWIDRQHAKKTRGGE